MINQFSITAKTFTKLISQKPFAASIDLTDKCNLRCPMCYWWTHKPKKELPDEKMIALAKRLRKSGIIHCTWVGGEPLLRAKLLEKLVEFFPANWVVTNATLPLPKLKNTFFIVSLDGTQKIHDQIRQKGLYQKIKKRISHRDDAITNTTIFSVNKNEPEKLLEEWFGTKIKGMTFNFATPMHGTEKGFYLTDEERNQTIDKLLMLKKEYKNFMLVSKTWLEGLRPKNVKKWYKDCLTRKFSISFSSDGKIKNPCVMGEKAICSSCGCHVPMVLESLKKFDLETIKILYRMMSF